MTNKEFLEKFNYAPYDDEELAEIACDVNGDLGQKAVKFLDALDDFNKELKKIGYEKG